MQWQRPSTPSASTGRGRRARSAYWLTSCSAGTALCLPSRPRSARASHTRCARFRSRRGSRRKCGQPSRRSLVASQQAPTTISPKTPRTSITLCAAARRPLVALATSTPHITTHTLSQVSHAWQDGHERKVQMLRAFLCLDALLAQTTVVALLLAVFLLPLGTGVNAWVPGFPFWAPSLLPLALLVLVLIWVELSRAGAVPHAWRPWALSPRTIWLDKCCIDQSSPEMIAAGTSSFGTFLADCDNMVAFVSPTYFTRLWWVRPSTHLALSRPQRQPRRPARGRCVYELATFCRMHNDPSLYSRLLLLSPEWPSVFNPFKSAPLSEEELAPLTSFRQADVQCAMPRDRAIVLDAIRREWGTEDRFELFVRT